MKCLLYVIDEVFEAVIINDAKREDNIKNFSRKKALPEFFKV